MRYEALGFIDQSALSLLHSNTYSVTAECVTSRDKAITTNVAERQDEYYIEAFSWPDRDQALDEAMPEACQKFDVPDVHVH